MNLKFKLTKKLTAVVQILDDNTAIFSDECSPSHKQCMTIIKAKSAAKLKKKCDKHAIKLAKPTRFPATICYVRDDKYEIIQLAPTKTQEYKVW